MPLLELGKPVCRRLVAFLNECGEDGAPVNLSLLPLGEACYGVPLRCQIPWLALRAWQQACWLRSWRTSVPGRGCLGFPKMRALRFPHWHGIQPGTPAIRHLNACKSSGLRTKQHHEINHFLYSVSSQVCNHVLYKRRWS
jgi:hypothetical protein